MAGMSSDFEGVEEASGSELMLGVDQARVTIAGRVVDQDGFPLPGVTIILKTDPNQGTTTDSEGKYTFTCPPGLSWSTLSWGSRKRNTWRKR